MAFNYKSSRHGAQRNLVSVLINDSKTVGVGDVVQSYTAGSLNNGVAALPLKGFVHAIVEAENGLKPSVILGDEASGFSDPEFWGEYNIIEPEKSIESAIKKISKQLKRN